MMGYTNSTQRIAERQNVENGRLMKEFCFKDMFCLDQNSLKTYVAIRKQLPLLTTEHFLGSD